MATKKTTEVKEKKATRTRAKAAPKVAVLPVAKKAEEKYVYAVGRRKTAVAQVRYYAEAKQEGISILVNGKSHENYFKTYEQREAPLLPLKAVGKESAKITVHVMGGGLSGQADAVKLGIARVLIAHDTLLRPLLRANTLLTRDPRAVERKKPGLKKARRAPQWAKR